MLRFLICCALIYWLWSVYLQVEALRIAVEQLAGIPVQIVTPWDIIKDWLRHQAWLQPDTAASLWGYLKSLLWQGS